VCRRHDHLPLCDIELPAGHNHGAEPVPHVLKRAQDAPIAPQVPLAIGDGLIDCLSAGDTRRHVPQIAFVLVRFPRGHAVPQAAPIRLRAPFALLGALGGDSLPTQIALEGEIVAPRPGLFRPVRVVYAENRHDDGTIH
jgi:hypothetical protein